METIFDLFRWLHIIAGFLALFTFWVPIVTKKGRKAHRRAGWVYVYAMIVVSVSAFYMGVYRVFFDPDKSPESAAFAWFLIFIAVLSAASAWYGIRVLRFKRRTEQHHMIVDYVFPVLLLVSGIGISVYGFVIDFALLKYFPILGVFLGSTHLIYWLNRPKLNMHWVMEHLAGMLSCCISTITAFAVFGAPRLLNIDSVSIIVWLLPTMLIVPLLIAFSNYYKRKYNPAR